MLFHALPAGLTILCLATLICAGDTVCYHPNGSPSDDVPCDPTTPFSMCCSSPAACLASGLCQSVSRNGSSANTDKFIRATCTDMTWASDVCPPFCMPDAGSSNTSTFNLNLSQRDVHVRQCHNQSKAFDLTSRFCCGFGDEKAQCCGTPEAFFELNVASSSSDTPVALNPADGSPKPWTPLSMPSRSSSTSESSTSRSTDSIALNPAGDLTSLSLLSSTSGSSSSGATSKTPLNAAPSSTSSDTPSVQPTTANPGTSDSSVPSTDPPSSISSPTASASSTPASGPRPTSPTSAVAASAVATELADSTSASAGSGSKSGWGKSGKSAGSKSDPDSDSHKDSSSRLSTGAVVGIGLGASVAAAGLVTISVYFFARRRLYIKQKRKWEEQMKVVSGGAGGAAGPGMVAVQTQTADGKPAVVMLAGGQNASPVALRDLKDLGWETRSVSELNGLESERPGAATTRSNGPVMEGAAKTTVEPRGGKTVSWFARHSIYEMG